jgi:hypothetical protein
MGINKEFLKSIDTGVTYVIEGEIYILNNGGEIRKG